MISLPLLRAGKPYTSLDTIRLDDVRTGEPVAEVSQANSGLITRDLLQAPGWQKALQDRPVSELMSICRKAGALFAEGELPLGDGTQTADDYVRQLSATTGMPESLCRGNMKKIRYVLDEMERVLGGLTRGLDLSVLDSGHIEQDGRPVSYLRQADMLGAVLPSNSPGVHSLWIPAFALKVPLVLRPGRQEPWSPYRIAQALLAAGAPPEAVSFFPSNYSGAGEILLRCHRSMMFGDKNTVAPWKGDDRVQLHGPGWSKVLIADDHAPRWAEYVDVIAQSVAENGGRSCVNASGVWTTGHADDLARGLAEKLAAVTARALDDPQATLAAFNPEMARMLSAHIDDQLEGAEDVSAQVRGGSRLVERDGLAFLLPTVVRCPPDHALAGAEYLFPFVSVVEVPQDEMLAGIGPTLVATLLGDDPGFRRQVMHSRHVERLNLGALPTSRVSWEQPHEGNLFEHLYRQRAFQSSQDAA